MNIKCSMCSALFTAVIVLLIRFEISAQSLQLDAMRLPEGFTISVYAEGVSNARSLTMGEEGTLFVGNRSGDKVWMVVDTNGDQRADIVRILLSGLTSPNGIAFRDGALFVAERSRILRYDAIEEHLDNPPEPVVIRDDFPTEDAHGWKYIAFGPDGYLYVPVGAPCNVCLEDDERFASITRMKPDGSDFSVFAHGIRNTVGFDWHPKTGELWFTDNGRDMMGDDIPPDELNRAPQADMHFGFPYCHGGDIADPDFGEARSCNEFVQPEVTLGPHVAALGMKFYTGKMFPEKYRNTIFIAEHGSWNRSEKIGYRVMSVDPVTGGYSVFAEGWLQGQNAWGRPVDVFQMPDGALLISDDAADAIYRIEYTPTTKTGGLRNTKHNAFHRSKVSGREELVTVSGRRSRMKNELRIPQVLIDVSKGTGGLNFRRN